MKIEHLEEQKLGSKVDLQKVKNRTCKRAKIRFKCRFAKGESGTFRRTKTRFKSRFAKGKNKACKKKGGSTLDIQVEIIDNFYNQRFQKYLNYHWIQKSIVRNVASKSFKRTRN